MLYMARPNQDDSRRIRGRERPCKPGPVAPSRGSTIISLGSASRPTSNDLPGGPWRGSSPALPIWSFTGWGLPCQPCHQDCGALLPHHFTLTCRETSLLAGGIVSVALSLASRPVAVGNHPDPRCPDFPPGGRPSERSPRPLTSRRMVSLQAEERVPLSLRAPH